MTDRNRTRLAMAFYGAVAAFTWFTYPRVMAFMLLVFLVTCMLLLSVRLMMDAARKKRRMAKQTSAQRVIAIVNEYDAAPHWWVR